MFPVPSHSWPLAAGAAAAQAVVGTLDPRSPFGCTVRRAKRGNDGIFEALDGGLNPSRCQHMIGVHEREELAARLRARFRSEARRA